MKVYKSSTNSDVDGVIGKWIEDFERNILGFKQSPSMFYLPVSLSILIFVALALIIPKDFRKRVLVTIAAGFSILLFLLLLFYFSPMADEKKHPPGEMIFTNMGTDANVVKQESSISEELPEPEIPTAISFLFSTSIVLLFLGTVFFIYRRIRIHRTFPNSGGIRDISEKALQSIETGLDYSQAILRCYSEMTGILKKEMGIIRSVSMTPHEFQFLLIKEGLPKEDVKHLTSLFERVRYGHGALSKDEERVAESCLKSVISALEYR